MVSENALEQRIEQLRLLLYKAYNCAENENSVLQISEELDMLLNQLDKREKEAN